MSNQVGLMLSFIFLAYFIILSGEILAYQKVSSKAMALTNEVAIYIENYGYESEHISSFKSLDYFDSYTINQKDEDDGIFSYTIITTKKYTAFSQLFDYMNQDIVCNLVVYRKE